MLSGVRKSFGSRVVYDRFDFDVPVGSVGDNYDRFACRMEEIEQSARILEQALKQIAPGPVVGDGRRHDSQRDRPAAPRVARAQQLQKQIQRVGDSRLRIYLYHIPPVAQVGFSLPLIGRLRASDRLSAPSA